MGASGALMAASVATSAISTATTAYTQSEALKMQGDYQKSVMEQNRKLAEFQAEDAVRRGDKESKELKKKVKVLIGSQRAAMAAQGIDIESGSALDVQADTAAFGASDALTIRNNAWREAWGYRVQGADYSSKGAWAQLEAKNAARNTLLTGGMTVAKDATGSLYSYKSQKDLYNIYKTTPKTTAKD